MKKLSIILSFTMLGLFASLGVDAQNYKSALGIRLGNPWSVSYKKFVTGTNAVEVYAGYRGWNDYNWFSVNAAYLVHNNLAGLDNLKWYYGAGLGVYFWNYGDSFPGDSSSSTTFSVQGYLGLEYTFDDAPFSLSLDWVPTYFFKGYAKGFGSDYGNLGIRYVLGR